MNRSKILTAAACLMLCSCGAYRQYETPSFAGTDQLYGISCDDSVSIADLSWDRFFMDEKLQALIREGLENNRDLRSAAMKVTEAEAALYTARLSFLPSLALSPSFSLAQSDVRYGEGMVHGFGISPAASWEADISGRLYNGRRKAQAAYEKSLVYRQSVETELVSSIAMSYYTLVMLDTKLDISKRTAANWKENVRIMKAMKEAGMVNEASVSQTEANSCSIEASLYDLEFQIRQIENTLSLLTGATPKSIDRMRLSESHVTAEIGLGVPAQLLSRRPDVMMAELDVRSAFYDTALAVSQFYPSLRLTGAYGWEKALTTPAGMLLSLGASASESIFNAGRNKAGLKAARARQEEAVLAFEKSLLKAGNEVNTALAKYQAARSKTDVRIQQIRDLESAVHSTQQLMSHSGATYLEVLTAQTSLLNAELLQVSDRYDEIEGLITLYKALGGCRSQAAVK